MKRLLSLIKKTFLWSLILSVTLSLAVGASIGLFIWTSPDVRDLKGCMTTTMYSVKVCPTDRNYVPFKSLPPFLTSALIASEDGAFYSHAGFDWFEFRQSVEQNLKSKTFKRGGSTLTQQLAKNAFLNPKKTLWRKIREAYLTYRLEQEFTKKEILEKYFNMVEFGDGIYGVHKASYHYFKKHPRDLNILQAVSLVMLLPNPKKYNQSFKKGQLTPFARSSLKTILLRLMRLNQISKVEYQFSLEHLEEIPWTWLSQNQFNEPPPMDFNEDELEQLEQELLEEVDRYELRDEI